MKFISRRTKFAAFLTVGIGIFLTHYFQPKFLYFPRRYESGDFKDSEDYLQDRGFKLLRIQYFDGPADGRYSYLALPHSGSSVALIILFGGNGMTALDWVDWITEVAPHMHGYPQVAFLLIDYPGYGMNSGEPSPMSMNESAEKSFISAMEALTAHNVEVREVNVLGHSIGAAVASKWIAQSNGMSISRLILSAPFTSITDMTSTFLPLFPRPVAALVSRHDWDNREAMRKISEAKNGVRVFVVHGNKDEIVPVRMGQELSKIANCPFIPVPHARHNDLLSVAKLFGYVLTSPLESRSSL
jgi:hypothetical protein